MRTLLFALLLLPLAWGTAHAQTGSAQAGKTLWEGPATQCRNCHGTNGEGAFGPDLAGRGLTVAQFTRAVRQPWGIMPAFIESQISDSEMADLVAYFNTLKPVAKPGPWRFEVPQNAPAGQRVGLATIGCLQCHGPIFNGPRQDAGAVGADFSWLTGMVYGHTVAMPKQWQVLGEKPAIRVRMGNYNPQRVPESVLRELWTWAQDLGFRPGVEGQITAGPSGSEGATYNINVGNIGLPGKGLTAEDLTVNVVVPAGTKVVRTTGANYQGERQDAELKATVAVWRLNRLAPKEHQAYTLTLSRAATASDNVRGVVRWTKPTVKTGPVDQVNLAPPPVTPATQ